MDRHSREDGVDRLGIRITLAIGIPLLAFLLMALVVLEDRYAAARHMEQVQAQAALGYRVQALVHALQAERDSSAGYLSGRDNEFFSILERARRRTHEAMGAFMGRADQVPPALEGLVSGIRRDLADLDAHRDRVDRLQLPPLEVLPVYDRLIQRLILVAAHLTGEGGAGDLSGLLNAYRPLLLLKEHAALERALGSAWLSGASEDPDVFYRYLSNQAIQEQQRSQFLSLAPPALGNALLMLESETAYQSLRAARAAIINHGVASRPPHLSAVEWFGLTRERLERLRSLEQNVAERILERARGARSGAWRGFAWMSVAGGVLLLLVLALSAAIVRDLMRRHRSHQQALDRAEYLVRHDALTGLPNRHHFTELLDVELGQAREARRPLGLCLVDLAGFSDINRIWGDAVADEILNQVAARLAAQVGHDGLLARIYGDQFGVILRQGFSVAQREGRVMELLAVLDTPFQVGARRIEVNGHAGLVACPPYPEHGSQLLAHAGIAVEGAKGTPGSRWLQFEPGMLYRHTRLVEMDHDLERALDQGQFHVVYQPQVDLEDGRIVSLEALLRWHHPQRGWIPPDVFIPRAEANGTIIAIGDFVLNAACRQAQHWRQAGLGGLAVAVNLSTVQLYQADLVDRVRAALEASGLPATALELELTETGLMEDMDTACQVLAQLRAMGVGLSVDDFGTGHSSLAYLRRFPVNCLKLDKRFVGDLEAGGDAEVIAGAVLALAQSLGLTCVAEGVETRAQADWLRARGCRQAQGYLYARPQSAEACERLLAAGILPAKEALPES
ncbi:putative bifunctional diguanylate cyclase/phosphodiesterase [Ectothiorhodospira mobilis]|uniref:putative bifunctional diguanylate cyclase/phosphodiesterase n=1 Tax=Ectothiorhodospira mobilis TaxID=195064 RepID=UPI001EE90D73|nr:EAL domain-containing protein [Ectothiorhodospira mobilis]MCG5535585.1 EAL domain-containing protein [Ectothiorhodospira mobilis]